MEKLIRIYEVEKDNLCERVLRDKDDELFWIKEDYEGWLVFERKRL